MEDAPRPGSPDPNPYAVMPAVASDGRVAIDENAGQPLFTLPQIRAATFVGTPLAGAWMMARNEQALGRPERFRTSLMFGVGLLALGIVLGLVLPEGVPGYVFALVFAASMEGIVRWKQGPNLVQLLEQGRPRQSHWRVLGIACVSLLITLVVMVPAMVALNPSLWELITSPRNEPL